MADKPWEEMSQDEKLDWLRDRINSLIDNLNTKSLPKIEGQLRALGRRLDTIEKPTRQD